MSKLLLEAREWPEVYSPVVYCFFMTTAHVLGYTEKHNSYLIKLFDNLFYPKPVEGSIAYRSLKALSGSIPDMYLHYMNDFTDTQKRQVQIWYAEFLSLEPMMESNVFLTNMINKYNSFISNLI